MRDGGCSILFSAENTLAIISLSISSRMPRIHALNQLQLAYDLPLQMEFAHGEWATESHSERNKTMFVSGKFGDFVKSFEKKQKKKK